MFSTCLEQCVQNEFTALREAQILEGEVLGCTSFNGGRLDVHCLYRGF